MTCPFQVWNLTIKMLGKVSQSHLTAKAAETGGVLLFCVEILRDNMDFFSAQTSDMHLAAKFLLASGEAALEFERTMASYDRIMPRDAQVQLYQHYMRHVDLYQRAGGTTRPKHHLMVHLIQRVCLHGNPRAYSTFRDESLNGVIARIAQSCHRTTFMDACHYKFSLLQKADGSMHMH